jgi:hypothetical protein
VVVVGVGISHLDLSSTDDAADGGSSASAADAGGGQTAPEAAAPDGRARKATGPAVRLSSAKFGHQVRQLARHTAAYDFGSSADAPLTTTDGTAGGSAGAEGRRKRDLMSQAARASCDPADWGPGRRVRARYDGQPGVLIYRPAQGDTQVVELYLCGRDAPTRSTTLARR